MSGNLFILLLNLQIKKDVKYKFPKDQIKKTTPYMGKVEKVYNKKADVLVIGEINHNIKNTKGL